LKNQFFGCRPKGISYFNQSFLLIIMYGKDLPSSNLCLYYYLYICRHIVCFFSVQKSAIPSVKQKRNSKEKRKKKWCSQNARPKKKQQDRYDCLEPLRIIRSLFLIIRHKKDGIYHHCLCIFFSRTLYATH